MQAVTLTQKSQYANIRQILSVDLTEILQDFNLPVFTRTDDEAMGGIHHIPLVKVHRCGQTYSISEADTRDANKRDSVFIHYQSHEILTTNGLVLAETVHQKEVAAVRCNDVYVALVVLHDGDYITIGERRVFWNAETEQLVYAGRNTAQTQPPALDEEIT
tara:strand:+ start:545 stop:1027 length:483 start_codon:yes stop_codon:yes gene_type:complete